MTRTCSALAATLLLIPVAGADTLVVATGRLGNNPNTIWAVDPDTGVGSTLFPLPYSVLGMTADASGRIWFTAEDGGLYTFVLGDPAPTWSGQLTRSALRSNLRMDGLAELGGVLHGWQEYDDFVSGEPSGLYSIDAPALTRALLWEVPDADLRSGFDADPASGLAYLSNDSLLAIELLDPLAPALQLFAPYPPGETDIDGLAVGGGFLWAIEDDSSVGGALPPGRIYKLDLATGDLLGSFSVPWSGQGLFAAGAYVEGCQAAYVVGRNGGANPASFVVQAMYVAGTFQATADNALAGQSLSRLFALDAPALLTLAAGQTVLCLDVESGELFTGDGIGPTASAGGIDQYQFAIPNDPLLCGFTIFAQVVHYGNPPFVLSNAQDLTIGG